MIKVKRILFPFNGLFERRNLKQRWWHRLFVVVFFVGFLLFALVIAALIHEQEHRMHRSVVLGAFPELGMGSTWNNVDFDYVKPVIPPLPPGYTLEEPPPEPDTFARMNMERTGIRAEVPSVGVVAFPANMPRDQINLFCAKLYDTVSAAERRQARKDWSAYILVLVVVFYLSQLVYRLFLYVVLSPEAK